MTEDRTRPDHPYYGVKRCKAIGPKPERYRCGLPEDHAPHPHSALIPTNAPWFGTAKPRTAAKGRR